MGNNVKKAAIGESKRNEAATEEAAAAAANNNDTNRKEAVNNEDNNDGVDSDSTWRTVEKRYCSKWLFEIKPQMLDKCVDKILEIDELNISWLPDNIERSIYKYVVDIAFRAIYKGVAGLQGMELLGHHLELELLNGHVPSVPVDGIHAENLKAIVENLMKYDAMKNIWLPNAFKREIFFNILLIVITVSQIVLGATKIDLLGHTIKLEFTRGAPSVTNIDPANSLIDVAAIYAHVDATLASEHTNLWYIPDYFERIMLFSIHLVVLTVLEEIFFEFKVNVLGDEVREMTDVDDIKAHLVKMRAEKKDLEKKLIELDLMIEKEKNGIS